MPVARVPFLALPLLLLLWSSGCGVYQDYPESQVTPWPLVQLEGEGHARPRALVIRRILDESAGGQRLDVVHQEVVASGLFAAVQTRATETQDRPGYDYVLELSLTTEDNYEWYAWLGLIPGFPVFSEEVYTLSCTVFRGQERLGEVEREASVTQALGLIVLPFNLIYSILPGRFSPYDLLTSDHRESLMIRAMTRDLLMLANERFNFRPPGLLSTEEKQSSKRKIAEKHVEEGVEHLEDDELQEAEQAFAQALKADPTYALGWYNLACTYARLGKLEAAEETLGYAVRAGWDDVEHLQADKDLAPLREREAFKRLIAELKKPKLKKPEPERGAQGEPSDEPEESSSDESSD